jgi:hypothetical protein
MLPLMTLEEIQQAIAKLSPNDQHKLRVWFGQFDAERPEPKPVNTAHKLGRLTGRAIADFRKRLRET